MDVILASLALCLLAPLIILIACLVRLKLGSPVLFHQTRPGLAGGPFVMHKFRTMLEARDQQGNLLPDEARLGAFGRFLRRTSLDELPELWNVLTGDMSLVGPRPLLMEYLPLYSAQQFERHAVRPGITGWAQVNGRNEISWQEKFRLDAWYVHNISPGLDLRILLLTLVRAFSGRGVTQPGHFTVEPFKGGES
jgi:lipopolysaccharide/colanic/teichoic acid biosynthesis glycosyltransferase